MLVEDMGECVDVRVVRFETSEVLKFLLSKGRHQSTTDLLVRLVDGVHVDNQGVLTARLLVMPIRLGKG